VVQEIGASLEELYNGKIKRFKISQTRIKMPDGMTKEEACQQCSTCDGQGIVMQVRRMGPMIQQMQTACPDCRGAGVEVKAGVRNVQQKKMLEVHIEKGMKSGTQIKLDGEGDEKPGMLPGDIVFVLKEKEHETFKRKGNDLLIQKKIQLSEALCGVKFTLNHLDDRELLIETDPGEVVHHQQVMAIEGEGMPFHGNPFTKVRERGGKRLEAGGGGGRGRTGEGREGGMRTKRGFRSMKTWEAFGDKGEARGAAGRQGGRAAGEGQSIALRVRRFITS
jgi:DnaJ-class molecular chaperone